MAVLTKLAITAIILASAFPYIQERLQTLSLMLGNHPAKLQHVNALPNTSIQFADRIRNCEDALIVEEDGVALLGCDPGRDRWNTVMGTFHPDHAQIPNGNIWVYRYGTSDQHGTQEDTLTAIDIRDYPTPFSLHPLGIEYHRPSSTLFIVNHHIDGQRVDMFSLDLGSHPPTARYKRTVSGELVRTPNAIAALSGDEFYFTNDHSVRRSEHPWLSPAETYTGFPGGSVVYVNLSTEGGREREMRKVAGLAFPNGIVLLNSSTVAVASSATAKIVLYQRGQDGSLVLTGEEIPVPFMPDNLSVDSAGTLLIAGHPYAPSLEGMVKRRRACTAEKGIEAPECWKADAPSSVAQWTRTRGVEVLYVNPGEEFGTGCTAVRDVARGFGLVSGLYEMGVLVWRQS